MECEQVVAVEEGDRDGEKMWFTLLRSLWRIFILERLRNSLSHEMCCAQNAMGMCRAFMFNIFKGKLLVFLSTFR